MRILFYSEKCNFCLKLLEYIDTNNLIEYFKMICIDKTNNIPKNIKLVPTIIDTTIEAPLEGKKAFEYVINQKYFNHPTNNVEYTKNGVPKPTVEEDSKAISAKTNGYIYIDSNNKSKDDKSFFDQVFSPQVINKPVENIVIQQKPPPIDPRVSNLIEQRNIQDSKMQALLRLRGK